MTGGTKANARLQFFPLIIISVDAITIRIPIIRIAIIITTTIIFIIIIIIILLSPSNFLKPLALEGLRRDFTS